MLLIGSIVETHGSLAEDLVLDDLGHDGAVQVLAALAHGAMVDDPFRLFTLAGPLLVLLLLHHAPNMREGVELDPEALGRLGPVGRALVLAAISVLLGKFELGALELLIRV